VTDSVRPGYQYERKEYVHEKLNSNKALKEWTKDEHEHDEDKQEEKPADAKPEEWKMELIGHVKRACAGGGKPRPYFDFILDSCFRF
jgi:hypothetical protein